MTKYIHDLRRMGSTLSIPSLTGHLLMILANLDHVISCHIVSCQAQGIAASVLFESFCDHVRRHGSRALGGNFANNRRPASRSHRSCHAGCSTIIRALVSSCFMIIWLFHQGIDLLAPGFQTWDINMFHHVPSCKMMIKTRCPPLAQFYGAMASEGPIGTSSQIGQWLVSVCHTTHIVYAYNI